MKQQDLYRIHDSGVFSLLDIHFAGFMARLAGEDNPALFLAAAMVSCFTRQGHICLDLAEVGGKQLLGGEEGKEPIFCPELNEWCKKLRGSRVIGNSGEYKPLVLDDNSRLYLFRYWDYQEKLAGFIRERVAWNVGNIDFELLQEQLARLFPADRGKDIDWQKVAACSALMKKFCVISGGPGTGKTTTIARILTLLLEQSAGKGLRIALAVPTGKAAARLQEGIMNTKRELSCPDIVTEAIPNEASTIHRLLGNIPDSPYFFHNYKNKLPFDVVVIDEASMVDLALLSKLVQALPLQARLILLGDKDQLASVEAGAVLADICDVGTEHSFSKVFLEDLKNATGYELHTRNNRENEPGIRDCIVQLQKNYRFGQGSGIGLVSNAVNKGDGDLAMKILKDGRYGDIEWKELPQPNAMPHAVRDIIDEYGKYLREKDPVEIFRIFEDFRILCALREGPHGVGAINLLIEKILKKEGLIKSGDRWYRGRPVLITVNDYNLRLFNGDIGITLPDPDIKNNLRVFFPSADGTLRKFHPFRLPEHETVYAMTVHKSQGSEFGKVVLLLPDRESPVLTRELIYTGITRAKQGVQIWGVERVFCDALSRCIKRSSGLRDALWKDGD
jgi:exodeoxyribonuclease V alpha subunit